MRFLTLVLLITTCSCSFFEKETTEEILVRVEDNYLLTSEIKEIVPLNTPSEDSALIIDNYIKNWIKDILILNKAELNLKENQKDVQKQLEAYRRSLIIYSYEQELIKQRLDTTVSNSEIETFYTKNSQNFKLRDDIVKVLYLKVNKKAPQLKKIRRLFLHQKENDKEDLKELAHQYAEKFHFNDKQWILFDELKKEVPVEVYQTASFLKNTKNIEVEDSVSIYFVHIKDFKLKKDVSPLNFEAKNIKNIIVNKRKLSLINKLREELYEEAFMKENIEIYTNENK